MEGDGGALVGRGRRHRLVKVVRTRWTPRRARARQMGVAGRDVSRRMVVAHRAIRAHRGVRRPTGAPLTGAPLLWKAEVWCASAARGGRGGLAFRGSGPGGLGDLRGIVQRTMWRNAHHLLCRETVIARTPRPIHRLSSSRTLELFVFVLNSEFACRCQEEFGDACQGTQ